MFAELEKQIGVRMAALYLSGWDWLVSLGVPRYSGYRATAKQIEDEIAIFGGIMTGNKSIRDSKSND